MRAPFLLAALALATPAAARAEPKTDLERSLRALREGSSKQAAEAALELGAAEPGALRRLADELGSDPPLPADRAALLRAARERLALVDPRGTVPELLAELRGTEPVLASSAALALALVDSRAAMPGLVELLDHDEARTREHSLSALGLHDPPAPAAVRRVAELLSSDPSPGVRRRAAWCLGSWRAGSPEVRDALERTLEGGNYPVAVAAVWALERLGPSASASLVRALRHAELQVPASCALAGFPARDVVPPLLAELERLDSVTAQVAGFRTLATLGAGGDEVLRFLEHRARHGDSAAKSEAMLALARCAPRGERTLAFVTRDLDSIVDWRRLAAARAASWLGERAAQLVPELAAAASAWEPMAIASGIPGELIMTPLDEIQAYLVALRDSGVRTPEVVTALLAPTRVDERLSDFVREAVADTVDRRLALEVLAGLAVRSGHDDRAVILCEALGGMGSTAALDLLPLLDRPQSALRGAALRGLTLAGHRSERVRACLEEALSERGAQPRRDACVAVRRLDELSDRLRAGLAAQLGSRRSEIRLEAARAFARWPAEGSELDELIRMTGANERAQVRLAAVEAVARAATSQRRRSACLAELLDPSERVELRCAAVRALEIVGGRSALEPLVAALADEDATVRRSAAMAIGALGAEGLGGLDALCEAAARDADPAVRARSLSAIGALGPAALGALGVLIDATHGSDSEIARAAVEALGHLEGAAAPALPALVRALRNEDRVVRDWSTLRDGAETVPRDWHVVEPKGNWLAVRTAAAHSLGAIGAERPELALAVLSDLDRVARGDDPTLAAAASGAAARIRAAAE